ncbi:MAG: GMC family oxidoreductase [Saprospiraceae bacterium]
MKYDIIIIGTGAGGATLAYKLAPSGKKILILERGEFLPKEIENWNPREVYTKGRYRTNEKWKDKAGNLFAPFTHYWVGGNTKMYGAALLRLREIDFKAREHFDGISPAWDLLYKDFEPWYGEAEHLYSVHGIKGTDPTEPPSSTSFPFPSLPVEESIQEIWTDMEKVGLRPSTIPIGVRLPQDKSDSKGNQHLSLFDGYPDPTEAKADAHVVSIQAALKYENVHILTGRKVEKLITTTDGKRVTSLSTIYNNTEEIYEADTIIVSAGAINSAALLLKSRNQLHPQGLGNSSGLLGKNLMLHNNGTIVAISPRKNTAIFQKSILLTDFYHGSDETNYPLGSVQLMGKTDPDTLKEEIEELHLNGIHKNQYGEIDLDYYTNHSVDFFITAEDLPRSTNQVIYDNGHIQLDYTPNNLKAYQGLKAKLIDILDQIGMKHSHSKDTVYAGFKLGVSGVSHQSGTCKFGADPSTSVLDLNCKMHDLDNVYVVDTSFFPSSGAVNPALTAMANALRIGAHLSSN